MEAKRTRPSPASSPALRRPPCHHPPPGTRYNGVVENSYGRVADGFYMFEPLPVEADMLEASPGYIVFFDFGSPTKGCT